MHVIVAASLAETSPRSNRAARGMPLRAQGEMHGLKGKDSKRHIPETEGSDFIYDKSLTLRHSAEAQQVVIHVGLAEVVR